MKTEYVRELRNSYMQITGTGSEVDYQMRMIESNEPEGFLRLSFREVNAEVRYLYCISSMISMEDSFIKHEMNWPELENLLKSFTRMFSSIEKYLIDYNGIVLEPGMVFCDTMGQWNFAYYSDKETTFEDDMKKFFEFVIQHVNHKDTRAVTVAYGIYKRVCEENINPDKLFEIEVSDTEEQYEVRKERKVVEAVLPEVVMEESEEPDQTKINMIYVVAGIYALIMLYFFIGIFVESLRIAGCVSIIYLAIFICLGLGAFKGFKWYKENKELFVKIKTRPVEMPFEKERIRIIVPSKEMKSEEDNMTMLLNDEDEYDNKHFLKWNDSLGSREYELTKDVTIIGSASDKADCIIPQKGVSRVHAKIMDEEGKYYLKDMNSTNGTIVNGRSLSCYEICEINGGDRIQLGNIECIFV